jgi:hypothetical protein
MYDKVLIKFQKLLLSHQNNIVRKRKYLLKKEMLRHSQNKYSSVNKNFADKESWF